MTLDEIIFQEAKVIGGYPRAAVGGLWAGATAREPGKPGVVEQVVGKIPTTPAWMEERPAILDWTPTFPEITIPEFPTMPTIPEIKIPEFPTIPTFPEIKIEMPGVPSMPGLTDEEGKPNLPLLIGLGVAGLLLIKKVG
jgi:hypothetical protein